MTCLFSLSVEKAENNLICQFSLKSFNEVNSEVQGLLDMDREGGYDSMVTSTPSLKIKSPVGIICSSSG